MSEELTWENYGRWFRTRSPEVRENLRRHALDPTAIDEKLSELLAAGKSAKSFKTKILYRAFYVTADASTRAKLEENNLIDPRDDFGVVLTNRFDEDPTESPSLRSEAPESSDSEKDLLAERYDLTDEEAEELVTYIAARAKQEADARVIDNTSRVVARFLHSPNARIDAAGLAYAVGLNVMNGFGSMGDFAKRIGVSKGSISKSNRRWKAELDLPDNPNHKPAEACAKYSQAQKQKHWRNQTFRKKDHERADTAGSRRNYDHEKGAGVSARNHQGAVG